MTVQSAARRPSRELRPMLLADPRRFAVMLAIAFILTSAGLLAMPRTSFAWDNNSFSSAAESTLVTLTNRARAQHGLRALKVDSKLTAIARSRSKDMVVRNYFSHTILGTNYNVFHILDQKGYCYRIAGENIGYNYYPDDSAAAAVQSQFMGSPDHRANILSKAWDVVGIGAYKGPGSPGKKMFTVIFADRCGSTSTSTSTAKPKPTPRPTTKPRPAATPKPTAKTTPKPTPTPTPTPAPTSAIVAEPTDGLGLGLGPGGQHGGLGDDNGNGGNSGNGAPPGQLRDADPTTGEGSLRVTDPTVPPGLFEAVVGGVTGAFFGI
jgi:uncharacterized protein YkwD